MRGPKYALSIVLCILSGDVRIIVSHQFKNTEESFQVGSGL